jgi:DNA repair protein RadA/Sms
MSKRATARPPRTQYRCQSCGHLEPKWLGKCPSCNEWSTLIEELDAVASPRAAVAGAAVAAAAAAPVPISQVR